jgi:anaerobic glycerol-3-phosphate dehydrogenase
MTEGALSRRVAMSKSNHFRQYAEEAMRSAHQSKIQDEKEAFIELARTWTAAAVQSERIFAVSGSPPEFRTA